MKLKAEGRWKDINVDPKVVWFEADVMKADGS
jgi:hypothetical protein